MEKYIEKLKEVLVDLFYENDLYMM